MYQLSDSDTTDSDDGIRFKTATTRDKPKPIQSNNSRNTAPRKRSRSRSRERTRRRSRSRSPRRHSGLSGSHRHRTQRRSRSSDERRQMKSSTARSKESKPREREYSRRSNETMRKRSKSEERRSSKSTLPDNSTDLLRNDDILGPVLPPVLGKSCKEEVMLQNTVLDLSGESSTSSPSTSVNTDKTNDTVNEESVCGPALPLHHLKTSKPDVLVEQSVPVEVCGPALPPHLVKQTSNTKDTNITNTKEERSIGPYIPEHLRKQLAESPECAEIPEVEVMESDDAQNDVDDDVNDDDDDDDCYGPLPPGMARSEAHVALEERALQMKLDLLAPPMPLETVREEWMIELPTVQAANLGLGPRQFRAKAGPDFSDRSSWTDTPQDKSRKQSEKAPSEKPVDLKKESEMFALRRRDEEQEAMVKKAKKKNKRDKSLMEVHQEKLNAKKKSDKEQGTTVRRPFNRDTDLKVNQFDDAQKKSMMKKAALLDDRFSHGQTKYL